jgi:hypothetical protein
MEPKRSHSVFYILKCNMLRRRVCGCRWLSLRSGGTAMRSRVATSACIRCWYFLDFPVVGGATRGYGHGVGWLEAGTRQGIGKCRIRGGGCCVEGRTGEEG